ncbi:MAG TPA: heme-copper oxidase subunit III [Actinomycetota bacterium]|nr:heme-copper oxidase subunit III [Actinomycetota bacterium]
MSVRPVAIPAGTEHRPQGIPTPLFGMVLFIASEVMFFGGFFGAYFDIRAGQKVWPPLPLHPLEYWLPWNHVSPLHGIATILTITLVSSSFTMNAGLAAIKRGDRRGLIRWLKVTLVLGVAFLSMQIYDYAHIGFGLRDGIFATLFFTMTGFHFAHVLGGALFLYLIMLQATKGGFSSEDHVGVEAATIYWHFVDIVWIGLFSTYYLLR